MTRKLLAHRRIHATKEEGSERLALVSERSVPVYHRFRRDLRTERSVL
jgi:hypothetical protein